MHSQDQDGQRVQERQWPVSALGTASTEIPVFPGIGSTLLLYPRTPKRTGTAIW